MIEKDNIYNLDKKEYDIAKWSHGKEIFMDDILIIVLCVIILWIFLVLIMLPVYFIRKRRNPLDKKNTMKSLLLNALIASILFFAAIAIGLIKMYINDIT